MGYIQARFEEHAGKLNTELAFRQPASIMEIAYGILPRDDSSLQWSETNGGSTENPAATLDPLYIRLVERYEQRPQLAKAIGGYLGDPACPMSSASLSEGKENTLAAWETAGQVYYANGNQKTMKVSKTISPIRGAARKHPVALANANGDTLFLWTEGTGWAKGGAVATL